MEHYICIGGCRGFSHTPGVCQNATCPKKTEALQKCDCVDGNHHGAFDFVHDHEQSVPQVTRVENE